MSLLASLRSLGSHLSCPGGPLSLRAGIGQALGPAAAQMFVRGMKVRSALKKRCEATLKTRSASGCTTVQQAPEKLPGHPKASAAIFQPWPTSLGTLLPVAASAVPEGSPWWARHPLLSITPGARRATSSGGATSRTSTAGSTRGTSNARDPSTSRVPSSVPPRASRTGARAASAGRERHRGTRASST